MYVTASCPDCRGAGLAVSASAKTSWLALSSTRLKWKRKPFQSQREKIELEIWSSYCAVLYSGCKSRQWESSLTSAAMLPCNHPPVDEPATPSHGSPSPSISQRNLNFTRLLLPALSINYTCGWGDFQGHYQDRGRGCEGRKDRTERGDGIVGCGRWNTSRNRSSQGSTVQYLLFTC